MTQVWSCGGGVQSAAIAALIVQGRLPKPTFRLSWTLERERRNDMGLFRFCPQTANLTKVGVDLNRVPNVAVL